MKRPIPGTIASAARRFIYLELSAQLPDHHVQFDQLAMMLESRPIKPSAGGVICEEAIIRTSQGVAFSGMSFKGDMDGWAAAVKAYAERENLLIATIDGNAFCVSDGSTFQLAECKIQFTDELSQEGT